MKNTVLISIGLVLIPFGVFAQGKVLAPITNQTAQSIAGSGPGNLAIPIKVDGFGNLTIVDHAVSPINGKVDIPNVGPNDRTQLPSNPVNSCTLQAPFGNTGSVFVGGVTITNALGMNEGIELNAGDTFGPIAVANTNLLFVAAQVAGDDIKFFCN